MKALFSNEHDKLKFLGVVDDDKASVMTDRFVNVRARTPDELDTDEAKSMAESRKSGKIYKEIPQSFLYAAFALGFKSLMKDVKYDDNGIILS